MIARRLLTPPVIIGFLLVAAVAVAGGFITSPLPIDTTVWSDFVASRTPAMNSFMTGASWLFDPKRAVVVALVVAGAVWWFIKKVMNALYILCSVVFSAANSFIIKHLYERPRPEEALRLITEDGYSFPSGHATAVTALFVSLVLVLTTTRVGRRLRYLLWAAALTLIVFICVTRLYLGVHWVTDVIAGFSVGLGSSMILAPFMIGPNACGWPVVGRGLLLVGAAGPRWARGASACAVQGVNAHVQGPTCTQHTTPKRRCAQIADHFAHNSPFSAFFT